MQERLPRAEARHAAGDAPGLVGLSDRRPGTRGHDVGLNRAPPRRVRHGPVGAGQRGTAASNRRPTGRPAHVNPSAAHPRDRSGRPGPGLGVGGRAGRRGGSHLQPHRGRRRPGRGRRVERCPQLARGLQAPGVGLGALLTVQCVERRLDQAGALGLTAGVEGTRSPVQVMVGPLEHEAVVQSAINLRISRILGIAPGQLVVGRHGLEFPAAGQVGHRRQLLRLLAVEEASQFGRLRVSPGLEVLAGLSQRVAR